LPEDPGFYFNRRFTVGGQTASVGNKLLGLLSQHSRLSTAGGPSMSWTTGFYIMAYIAIQLGTV